MKSHRRIKRNLMGNLVLDCTAQPTGWASSRVKLAPAPLRTAEVALSPEPKEPSVSFLPPPFIDSNKKARRNLPGAHCLSVG